MTKKELLDKLILLQERLKIIDFTEGHSTKEVKTWFGKVRAILKNFNESDYSYRKFTKLQDYFYSPGTGFEFRMDIMNQIDTFLIGKIEEYKLSNLKGKIEITKKAILLKKILIKSKILFNFLRKHNKFVTTIVIAFILFVTLGYTCSFNIIKEINIPFVTLESNQFVNYLNSNFFRRCTLPTDYDISDLNDETVKKKLAIDLNYDYVKSFLNEPTFINTSEKPNYIEYIHVYDDRYLQVIVDKDNKVIAFSITNIKSPVSISFYDFDLVLGETTLADYSNKPNKCFNIVSVNGPMYYFEEYYLGRPGKYLYYYIGSTKPLASLMDKKAINSAKTTGRTIPEYNCNDNKKEERENYVITNFFVSKYNIQLIPFSTGPNYEQLNLLNN